MNPNNFLSSSKNDLKHALDSVNRKMQEEEAQGKASAFGLSYINLYNFPLDLNVLGIFSEEESQNLQALPFYREGRELRIGAVDPYNPLLKEKLRELENDQYKVSLYVISLPSLVQTQKLYSKVLRPKATHNEIVKAEDSKDYMQILEELKDVKAQASKTASQLLEAAFGAAMFYKSSDIHLEPEEHFVKIRFRIDGVLQDVMHLDKALQRTVVSRIKILSKAKLNVENVPQDGRFTFYYSGKPIDVRVSILPSAYGEEVVMRLLGTGAVSLKIKDLGFVGYSAEVVERALQKPNGCIITTGPTGSGKTTTLYAFLNELNEPGVKIITLEDPVEYKLEGIVQTPIDHSVDFDFAKGLRAILRQDPDIVMVGEIRDQETAEVSMQAALTGHLVLSTLHTNDAAGAIPRLINMGVKPFVLAPALSTIIAQRLVRRLCQDCKVPAVLSPSVLERINYIFKTLPQEEKKKLPKDLQFYHGKGCEKCHSLGYVGRIGVYEVLEVTENVQKLILSENSSMGDYRKVAVSQGMLTMVQDGLFKALEGVTDVEEVFRVAGD